MSQKKIPFTKKQFHTLLKAAYIAHHLGSSYNEETLMEFAELASFVFTQAKTFDLEHFVEGDRPTLEFMEQNDSEIFEIIQNFKSESFASELVRHLSLGCIFAQLSKETLDQLSTSEWEQLLEEAEGQIGDYLEEEGLSIISLNREVTLTPPIAPPSKNEGKGKKGVIDDSLKDLFNQSN